MNEEKKPFPLLGEEHRLPHHKKVSASWVLVHEYIEWQRQKLFSFCIWVLQINHQPDKYIDKICFKELAHVIVEVRQVQNVMGVVLKAGEPGKNCCSILCQSCLVSRISSRAPGWLSTV